MIKRLIDFFITYKNSLQILIIYNNNRKIIGEILSLLSFFLLFTRTSVDKVGMSKHNKAPVEKIK